MPRKMTGGGMHREREWHLHAVLADPAARDAPELLVRARSSRQPCARPSSFALGLLRRCVRNELGRTRAEEKLERHERQEGECREEHAAGGGAGVCKLYTRKC